MPEVRTVEYIINAARQLTGIFDRSLLRDGFTRDRGEADRDLLTFFNQATSELYGIGHFKCRWYVELVEDQAEYKIDREMGLIQYVLYNNTRLEKTTEDALDRPGSGGTWRNRTGQRRPKNWYNDISDYIGFYPTPSVSDDSGEPSITILAEALQEDLTEPDDFLRRLPAVFHDEMAYGTAIRALATFGDGESIARRSMLLPHWYGGRNPETGIEIEGVLKRVEKFARARAVTESVQIIPASPRNAYFGGR